MPECSQKNPLVEKWTCLNVLEKKICKLNPVKGPCSLPPLLPRSPGRRGAQGGEEREGRGVGLFHFFDLLGRIQKWILTFECFLQFYSVFLFSRFF